MAGPVVCLIGLLTVKLTGSELSCEDTSVTGLDVALVVCVVFVIVVMVVFVFVAVIVGKAKVDLTAEVRWFAPFFDFKSKSPISAKSAKLAKSAISI